MNLQNFLKKTRESMGLSRQEFGNYFGYSRFQIYAFENGRSRVDGELVYKIMKKPGGKNPPVNTKSKQ